jgi:hypothetical protein
MTSDRTRAREKPGCSRRGEIRSAQPNSGVDCNTEEGLSTSPKWVIFHREGVEGASRLLSCPASGRPLYLEGEAADPILRPRAAR